MTQARTNARAEAGWDELDPVLNAPKRLAAMALLVRADSADFGFLRDHLGVSDSDLSKQMSALQTAGYVASSRSGRGRGGLTTYRTTKEGKAAYRRHREVLVAMVGD